MAFKSSCMRAHGLLEKENFKSCGHLSGISLQITLQVMVTPGVLPPYSSPRCKPD